MLLVVVGVAVAGLVTAALVLKGPRLAALLSGSGGTSSRASGGAGNANSAGSSPRATPSVPTTSAGGNAAATLPRRYRPTHAVDRAALAKIDLRRVLGELWPRWVSARASAPGAPATKRALATLRAALHGEPNLVSLIDAIAARLQRRPVGAQTAHLLYLSWAFGAYLQAQGKPWRVVGGVRVGGAAFVYYIKTYRVARALKLEHPAARLRLIERADRLDLADPLSDASAAEGALVYLAAARRLAVRSLWPLLDERARAELSPGERAWAAALRDAVKRALAPTDAAALRDSVGDRLLLRHAAAAINARARCGSRFRLGAVSWRGLGPRDRRAVGAARAGGACPEVKATELRDLLGASSRLARRGAALRSAIGALVAEVARGAAFEATQQLAAARAGLRCRRCGAALARPADHARLAGLLALLASPRHATTALARLCSRAPRTRAASDAAATAAVATAGPLALVRARLGRHACRVAAAAALARRARTLRHELFGTAAVKVAGRVALPAGLPRRLALPR